MTSASNASASRTSRAPRTPVQAAAAEFDVGLRDAAFVLGVRRVAEATALRGG